MGIIEGRIPGQSNAQRATRLRLLGPARASPEHARPDLLFPQMENPGVTKQRWTPWFLDYLYVSLTNATAFSPTDTMPLTTRAKLIMGAQSLASLTTIRLRSGREWAL